MSPRDPEPLPALTDPRLGPFTDLIGRRRGPLAVVEGAIPTQRACASGLTVEAVVCTPGRVEALRSSVPASTPWWVASKEVLGSMLGFHFHRGVLASVRVPASSALPTDALAARVDPLVAVAVGFSDPANVGALVRAARALGVDHVIVDAEGADAFARKAIRASAGHVFTVGLSVVEDLLSRTLALRDRLGAQLLALTPAGAHSLPEVTRARPRIVAFGSEGPGLPESWLAAADLRVRIPLAQGVDSLNVASAAAVSFYALSGARARSDR